MTSLTKVEAAWVKRLQKVLDECPSDRIGAFTVGDPTITLYDRSRDQEIDAVLEAGNIEYCQAVSKVGAELTELKFPFQVHSTSG